MEEHNIEYYTNKWRERLALFEQDFIERVGKTEAGMGFISKSVRHDERWCFTHRIGQFLEWYEESEIVNSDEFKTMMARDVISKLKEHSVCIDEGEFISLIGIYPETMRDIDLVADDKEIHCKNGFKNKDYVILKLIEKDPKLIDLLPKEKLIEIGKIYEKQRKELFALSDKEKSDSAGIDAELTRLYEGDSDFIMQLIAINPGVLQTENIQAIIKENPELEKKLKF